MGNKKSKVEKPTIAPTAPKPRKYNVMFAGPTNSGKSSTIQTLKRKHGYLSGATTLGIDYEHVYAVCNDVPITLRIYDVNEGADGRFYDVMKQYYASYQISVIFLFYSVDDLSQFDNLETWVTKIASDMHKKCKLVVVMNKTDTMNFHELAAHREKLSGKLRELETVLKIDILISQNQNIEYRDDFLCDVINFATPRHHKRATSLPPTIISPRFIIVPHF